MKKIQENSRVFTESKSRYYKYDKLMKFYKIGLLIYGYGDE